MSGRELVILLLGLAIVAVMLRGLYVAVNARRGQIKLAIDKNIPKDVDLEALELAELPGGGARIVNRSLEEVNRQNSALDIAETKAKAFELADEDEHSHIPVLMDAVELSAVRAEIKPHTEQATEIENDPSPYQDNIASYEDEIAEEELIQQQNPREHRLGDDWGNEEDSTINENTSKPNVGIANPEREFEDDAEQHDDPDAVLFDYEEEEYEQEITEEVDPLRAVAPDYIDEVVEDEDILSQFDEGESAIQHSALDDSPAQIQDDDDYQDLTAEDEYEEQEEGAEETVDPENNMDDFSMTAGERIGYNAPAVEGGKQSSLFDTIDEAEQETAPKPKKGRSLFSLFRRKSTKQEEAVDSESDAITDVESARASDEVNQSEPEDVLLEEEIMQEQGSEQVEEIVDELEEIRVAPTQVEEPDQQSVEFEHSEVLVINVSARQGRVFAGEDLLQILITAGLKFGDMNIFHKRLSKENQGAVIFSVANMLNPGTFDLNNMDEFTTLGISFFLALPTPINNLDAFEQMLDVAQDIRDTLDGELKDDHRNGMTAQTIEHYRQRIRDFELRRLKAVAARG